MATSENVKKAVQFARTGPPSEVVEVVDLATDPVGENDVLLDVLAAPINPSHLLTLSGSYGVQPELPAVPGAEGLGQVVAVGASVTDLKPGDRVMIPPYSGTWRQQVVVRAAEIPVTFAGEGDPVQLAMLMANPPTAHLLLTQFVDLRPGDWVIQNSANSAVGQYLMKLARIRGIQTLNVVRRAGLEDFVKDCGGDACLVDGDDLLERVAKVTGGAAVRLAADAVGGDATARLAACLADAGTVVNYGALSGKPCQLPVGELIFRDIRLRGVWVTRWLRDGATPEQRRTVYEELGGYVLDGRLSATVEATYPLEKIKDAVAHAMQPGRSGKIVITPNSGAR